MGPGQNLPSGPAPVPSGEPMRKAAIVLLVPSAALLFLCGCLSPEHQARVDAAMNRAAKAEQVLALVYGQFQSGEIDTPEELAEAVKTASASVQELGAAKTELETVKEEAKASWWKLALPSLGSMA